MNSKARFPERPDWPLGDVGVWVKRRVAEVSVAIQEHGHSRVSRMLDFPNMPEPSSRRETFLQYWWSVFAPNSSSVLEIGESTANDRSGSDHDRCRFQ
jgi:hypothetical protein